MSKQKENVVDLSKVVTLAELLEVASVLPLDAEVRVSMRTAVFGKTVELVDIATSVECVGNKLWIKAGRKEPPGELPAGFRLVREGVSDE